MLPLKTLQLWMQKNNKDVFLINRTDEFLSEYIAPYAERLNWISNFSGSAGRAIIEQRRAYIFVDGRYTNQAMSQINPKFFKIKHLNNYWLHLKKYNQKNKIIALDPKLHSVHEVDKMKIMLSNASLDFITNPIDLCWMNQPDYPKSKAFIHNIKYAGQESVIKIQKIQKILKLASCDFCLLSSLDSIAWLLNIRGDDIKNTPLIHCFAIIPCQGKVELFTNSKILHLVDSYKKIANFNTLDSIVKFINSADNKKVFGIDETSISYYFKILLNKKKILTKNINNPCIYPKAIKNDIEIDGAKKANIRDGASIVKFLYWLKNEMIVDHTNEIIASDYLFNLRRKNDLFYSLSFDTISAFGSHAALPHYRVNNESNLSFKKNKIYLVDSGAQYLDGTTDITRTVILGDPTEEQKDRFTRVLKGHIAIAKVIFPVDTKGSILDSLARKALLEINCDYDHGTGHGIGSFLSVHEGPQRIAKSQGKNDSVIKNGMILSNEPGFYKEGEYGIRIENLIICRSNENNSLFFETISWAPFDLDLIDIFLLNNEEIEWINDYHKSVFEKVSPNLNVDEKLWLKSVTSPIVK